MFGGLSSLTSGWIWSSSFCVAIPRVIVTGSLPMGFIVWPLTVRGVTREGSRLSLWSPSSSTISVYTCDGDVCPRVGKGFDGR